MNPQESRIWTFRAKNVGLFTGFRDKLLEKELVNIGAEVSNSISKNTFLLLVNSLSSDNGKADKARKLGVKMMTPYMFNSKYLQ